MSTLNQLISKKQKRIKKNKKSRSPYLNKCPQKKGVCTRIYIRTPKKPNSALRKVARVRLINRKISFTGYIPGIGHNLQDFSIVLVRGGRAQDLPGVKYTLIRGKYDFEAVWERKQARSKYGAKDVKKLRRKVGK